MIIKIIPEEGDKNVVEAEHHGINEFFIFGNKKDEEGDMVDFHDWKGSYRYLMGSLAYFNETIKDERNNPKSKPAVQEIKLAPPTIEVENEIDGKDNSIPFEKTSLKNVKKSKKESDGAEENEEE